MSEHACGPTCRYRVILFRSGTPARAARNLAGLTLEQAQAHCSRPDTRGPGWFHGYTCERKWRAS